MRTRKIVAAQRLAASLSTKWDFGLFLLDHPNEQQALDRLLHDLGIVQGERYGKENRQEGACSDPQD